MKVLIYSILLFFSLKEFSYADPIPKLIHYIWLGNPIKQKYVANINKITRVNPDYQVLLWTDRALKNHPESFKKLDPSIQTRSIDQVEMTPLMQEVLSQEMTPPTEKRRPNYGAASDILRIQILKKLGGIYLDTDVELTLEKGFGTLEAKHGILIYGDRFLNNCILAAVLNSEIIETADGLMNWRYRDVLREAKNGYMASLSLTEIKSDLIPHEEKVFHSVSEFWDRKLAIPKLTLDDSGVAQPGDFNTQFRQYLTVGMSGPGIIGFALNRYMSKLEKNVLRAMALTAPDTLIYPFVTKEAQLASSFGDAYFFSYMKKEGLQMTAPEFLKSEYFKNSVEFGFQYRMESIPELRVPEGLRHSSDLSWLGE